ncbi:MAG: nucleotidyltransferase family protein [Sulfolobales archaeon]
MKAVILAGGFGKRLRPLTEDIPKPLIEISGKPIIIWQIEWLKRHDINEIILLVGYKKERIIESLGSGSRYGVKISYVVEDEPLGTGGAIKNAEPLLKNEESFIAVNGDIITNIDIKRLANEFTYDRDVIAGIAVVPLRSPYGIVELDERKRIRKFVEKPLLEEFNINAGVYILRREIFSYLPEKGDIERTAFPRLAGEGKLKAIIFRDSYWRSIDTYKDIEEASTELERLYLR